MTNNNERSVDARLELLRDAAMSYDTESYPDLEHLRPHQLEAVDEGLDYVAKLTVDDLQAPQGAAILSPPGSGKTITGAGLLTALSANGNGARSLYLTPRNLIRRDAQARFEEFAPSLTTFKYDSKGDIDGDVCMMSYQALAGAIDSGFLKSYDPDIVASDEVHHVIDGVWAQRVEEAASGRLSIGMTATPAYNHIRTIRELYPNVLVHKTFREGIEDGFVGSFTSQTYRSHVQSPTDYEGMTRDVIDALTIAKQYAELGKVGIIACVPGDGTAHSRSLETLASSFPVGDSQRQLRVHAINGTMPATEIENYMDALKTGDIDALAYTNLLGEGVDIPEIDYMIILRWTQSVVLAAQTLGRATRLGKLTDVHEFHRPGFVSHMDAFNEDFNPEGFDGSLRKQPNRDTDGAKRDLTISTGRIIYDRLLANSMTILSESDVGLPEPEAKVTIGDSVVRPSYEWMTAEQIAAKTLLDVDQASEILAKRGHTPVGVELHGYERKLYRPDAMDAILAELKPPTIDPDTHVNIQSAYRNVRAKARRVGSFASFKKLIDENDLACTLFIDENGKPIIGVSIADLSSLSIVPSNALRGLRRLASDRESRRGTVSADKNLTNGQTKTVQPSPVDEATNSSEADSEPLEKGVENFLVSIVEPENESPSDRELRGRKLRFLKVALNSGGAASMQQLELMRQEIASFDPDGIVFRNLERMSKSTGNTPERVLASIVYAIQHS